MSARTARRRLFFALWPEPIAAEQLAAARPAIEASLGRLDDLHLTVLFLGQVPESQINTLATAAGEIHLPPIHQPLVRLEVWPQSGVLCLVGDPVDPLERLRHALERAAEAAGLDRPPERLEFRAHVTLGRGFTPDAGFVPPPVAPVLLVARRFTLAESVPRRDGRRYEALASWPLS
jgi:2'-5' RNA ligase